jgi:hypothetical protein
LTDVHEPAVAPSNGHRVTSRGKRHVARRRTGA